MIEYGSANDRLFAARGCLLGALMTLPILNAGSTLFLVEAWVQRERKGAEWCRKKKIGPIIEALQAAPPVRPAAVMTRGGCVTTEDLYADTRDLLTLHCRACGGCEHGRKIS